MSLFIVSYCLVGTVTDLHQVKWVTTHAEKILGEIMVRKSIAWVEKISDYKRPMQRGFVQCKYLIVALTNFSMTGNNCYFK